MANEESSPEAGASAKAKPVKTSLQLANAAFLFILVILAGSWLFFYTNWIPQLKEWVSGGHGLFLVAAIATLVPKASRKLLMALRGCLLSHVLPCRACSVVLALLLMWLAWFAATHGALRLALTKEFREDFVEVFDSTFHPIAHDLPPAEGEFRAVVPASLFASSSVWFAVKNRPYEPIALAGHWRRPLVSVPSGLTREVVVLYGNDPFLRLTDNGPGANLSIDIRFGDGRVLRAPLPAYKGQAVWLGCRTSVELPAGVKAALQHEMRNPEDTFLRPTCPFASDDVCEFDWTRVATATIEWKLGKRGWKSPIEFEKLAKIDFVRRRAIEF